jgi:ATP-dependent phosphofructokinase / diphosphate-dependent phosphofructokinase
VLAILCAGAPAPGINSVIAAVTIEALNSSCSVLGIYEGFKQLKQGLSLTTPLTVDSVTRIYQSGGSILRTSKQQLKSSQEIDNALRVLEHHRVRYLVTIGVLSCAVCEAQCFCRIKSIVSKSFRFKLSSFYMFLHL